MKALAILLIILLAVIFVVSFIIYKKIPAPTKDKEKISDVNCSSCNKECSLRKDEK